MLKTGTSMAAPHGNRDDAVGRLDELVERAFTESSKQNELDGEDTTAPLMLF